MLAPNVIILYDGTHASIPTNWSRDTRFDDNYVKATTSDWGSTGGNATHTHTSPSHTHTYTSNSHTHTTGSIANASNTIKTDAQHQDSPPQDVSTSNHTHPSQTSGAFTSSSISSVVATISATSNEYSRYHFIFIKSAAYNFIPPNGIILRNDTNTRIGGTHFDTADARYMKGATTGADAGTAVDVVTHTHAQTHSHTLEHSHSSVNSGNGGGNMGGKDISSSSPGGHSHTVSFATHSVVVTNNTNAPAYTNDLAYKELHFWKFTVQTLPQPGDIAILIDGDVPPGWSDMELSDVYVRGKSSGGSLATGGSLTHVHDPYSHSHAGAGHTHTWSTSSTGGSNAYRNGGSTSIVGDHTHSGTTSSSTNASTGSSDMTFDSSNFEPTYIKVRFIQLDFLPIGGGALLSLL